MEKRSGEGTYNITRAAGRLVEGVRDAVLVIVFEDGHRGAGGGCDRRGGCGGYDGCHWDNTIGGVGRVGRIGMVGRISGIGRVGRLGGLDGIGRSASVVLRLPDVRSDIADYVRIGDLTKESHVVEFVVFECFGLDPALASPSLSNV